MDKNEMAVDVFNKRAERYQDKFMDTSLYHDTFDLFCSKAKQGAHVLDVACGPGNITKYLLQKRPDFKILGIDLAPNMLTLAEINNPTARFQLMDCRDIGMLNERYDAIMCGFCLPYLSKEEAVQLIKEAVNLLTDNGVLYLSTMEDDYSKSGFETSSSGDQVYIHYHQADYLTHALQENGFEIIDIQRKSYPPFGDVQTVDLVVIGVKI